ncbi:la-related protein 6b [Cheilinus undulatus]|uniref:la-related protein 6b n=1 Tax=Cheilinus undulatus TaxID=241271 RepID=UPI001BD1CAFF|nr:la-related protein 6b [Cheilinus undulatus]
MCSCRDCVKSSQEEEREGELLCLKIRAQLEDLFSDSHLAQDGFLLKHVQRRKQGYVSLKLLTCLKKIKALTTDWHQTLAGAENSKLLEVNDERTKVRRKKPLPKWLLCSPTSRLLLTWNISKEKAEEDGVARGPEHPSLSDRIFQKFSSYGDITSMWILHPGTELPKELQTYAKRHKELGQHLCAVVKFAELEAVRQAYISLKAEEETCGGEGMHVVPLGYYPTYHLTEEKNNQDQPEEENPLQSSLESVQEEPSVQVKVSVENINTSKPQETKSKSTQRTLEQLSTSFTGQYFSGVNQSSRMNLCAGDCDRDNSQSPWVLRRKHAAAALNLGFSGDLKERHFLNRVLRQPFGPDGTRGFLCRLKKLHMEIKTLIE